MNKFSPINISPDKIVLSCNEKLRREATSFGGSVLELNDSPSLIALAYENEEDSISAGDEIVSNRDDDSGSTVLYRLRDTGINLLVRNDLYLIKVMLNIPKMVFGLPHNGRCVRTQHQIDEVVTKVRNRLKPYLKNYPAFDVSEIELGINVDTPVPELQSFFWGRNLKGSHQTPVIRPGQAVSMNRDRRSDGKRPELSFHLYDKKVELLAKFDPGKFEHLPSSVTRLEFALRGNRLKKEFGGNTLDKVTLAAMQDVFWRLFDKFCMDYPIEICSELGPGKADMLTNMIFREQKYMAAISDDIETVYAYWLRSNIESIRKKAEPRSDVEPDTFKRAVRDARTRANAQYRKAAARANALLGRRLSDYVNRDTPFVEIF